MDSSLAQIPGVLGFASSVQWERSGLEGIRLLSWGCLLSALPILGHIPAWPGLAEPTQSQPGLPGQSPPWDYMGSKSLHQLPLPSCNYLAGSRAAMMTGNQNKSNSQLLPVAESWAVSGTEEIIACLSRDSFPSCVGTTEGKQVISHKKRRGTAQSSSAGKATVPEAFQRQRWP